MLQRRPLIMECKGLEQEGFESGLLKIGIEGGEVQRGVRISNLRTSHIQQSVARLLSSTPLFTSPSTTQQKT